MLRATTDCCAPDRGLRRDGREVHRRRRHGGLRRPARPRGRRRARGPRGLRILDAIAELNGATRRWTSRCGSASTPARRSCLGARPERGEAIVDGRRRQHGLPPAARRAGRRASSVGEATYEATGASSSSSSSSRSTLKGKAEPVAVCAARGAARAVRHRLTRTHATPLVGREHRAGPAHRVVRAGVRDRIRAPRHHRRRARHRQVAARRASSRAHVDRSPELVTWRQGRCLPYGDGVTFWALGEIVKAEAGILETRRPRRRRDEDRRAVRRRRPRRARGCARACARSSGWTPPAAAREENFAAWRRFLELLAGTAGRDRRRGPALGRHDPARLLRAPRRRASASRCWWS